MVDTPGKRAASLILGCLCRGRREPIAFKKLLTGAVFGIAFDQRIELLDYLGWDALVAGHPQVGTLSAYVGRGQLLSLQHGRVGASDAADDPQVDAVVQEFLQAAACTAKLFDGPP